MSLPILQVRQEPSATDLVRLFHQCDAHWVEQLSDPVAMEVGTAYANAEFSKVWIANHVRDAALHGEMTPEQAVAEVEAYFTRIGTECAYWVMNPSAAEAQTRPLVEYLVGLGYRLKAEEILYLRGAGAEKAKETLAEASPTGVQIIPARASYRHARALAEEAVAELWDGLEQLVEADQRRLDDPHLDALLALKDGRAVAGLGVLAVGEMGMIEDVYVVKDCRRRGIGRMMMQRALEICARSLLKHVFIVTEPNNAAALGLYRSLGFEKIGEFVRYRLETQTRHSDGA